MRPKRKSVIGDNCTISPLASVASENVVIGNNVIIEDFAVVKENSVIGNDCTLHNHVVLGGQSFNPVVNIENVAQMLRDAGGVILGERVEICSLSHIAAGTLPCENTMIEDDVKIDALVHIAHGVHLGARSRVTASVCIGGNVQLEADSFLGLNCTICNSISIGNHSRVSLGAVATRAVPSHQTVTGNFAIPHEQFIDNLKKSLFASSLNEPAQALIEEYGK